MSDTIDIGSKPSMFSLF